jgi:hypothetical protein
VGEEGRSRLVDAFTSCVGESDLAIQSNGTPRLVRRLAEYRGPGSYGRSRRLNFTMSAWLITPGKLLVRVSRSSL